MRLVYEWLCPGELPLLTAAKSRSVHIWVPKQGWIRQSRSVQRKHPELGDPLRLRGLNSYVPLLEVSTPRFSRWLREKVRLLNLEKERGVLHIVVLEATPEYIQFGVYHDTRWWPKTIFGQKPGEKPDMSNRGKHQFLPTEITL